MTLLCFLVVAIAYRLFGRIGLYSSIPILLIVANVQVVKTIDLFGFTATMGNGAYAASFLATDILSENHGKSDARRAVMLGFFTIIVVVVLMNLALLFRPGGSDFAHSSLHTIFGIMPRIALGSFVAYGVSQLHDVWAYNIWMKKIPGRKTIWIRNNLSTVLSQLIDTTIFVAISFYGTVPLSVLIEIMVTTYAIKVVAALLDTPFLYMCRVWNDQRLLP